MVHRWSRAASALAATALVPAFAIGFGLAPAGAEEDVVLCHGMPATIIGTAGHDRLEGTEGPDVIAALGGGDVFMSAGGADVVCGGRGADDLFAGEYGDSTVIGGKGSDRLGAADGNDVIRGGKGRDVLFGYGGDDVLRGGAQQDFLAGGDGGDTLVGGASAFDRVGYSERRGGVVVDLRETGPTNGSPLDGPRGARDTIRRVEEVVGSQGGDILLGDRHANNLIGFTGRDQIDGRAGDDTVLLDDRARDVADCGAGNDVVRLDRGRDVVSHCEVRNNG